MSKGSSVRVVIYSTPSCKYCSLAKQFFDKNGVKYVEYNVAEDKSRREEMVEKSGQLGVPVIEVGDDVVVGFDEGVLSGLILNKKDVADPAEENICDSCQ